MQVQERFLTYVHVHTTSDETTGTSPSTGRQFDLAHLLEKELKTLGLSDVYADDHCYVYAGAHRLYRPHGYFTGLLRGKCPAADHPQL